MKGEILSKIIHILSNLKYMTKMSFKFAPWKYLLAVYYIIMPTVKPFVNLLFPKWILDELSGERRWNTVFSYLLIWLIINGIFALTGTFSISFIFPLTDRYNTKEELYFAGIDSNMDYSKLESGAVLDQRARLRSNIQLMCFVDEWTALITPILQLAGYTYIIATLHPLMIIFILTIIYMNSVLSRKKLKLQFEFQEKIAKFQRRIGYLYGALIGQPYAKEVRINRAADWLGQKYEAETNDYMETYSRVQNKNLGIESVGDLIAFAQTIVLYAYSAFRVVTGAITIGSFSMYIGAVTAFSVCFSSLITKISGFENTSQYIDLLKEYFENSAPSYAEKGILDIAPPDGKHEIEFRGVSFKYPGCDNYALKNVSVKINSGERLSVVGYNGAGKSTFIKLICRLYEPTEGVILYNGTDISTLKFDQYTSLLSVVFQDYNLYLLSVRENVALNIEVSDDDIMKALEQSGLAKKVRSLPHGLDTQIGRAFDPEGVELSGGEGQKLACARAYLKNAPIVILDEPTASLDPISENQLYERFNNIIGKKTAVYISHRLASVKFCDRIIVFENGEIIEQGTHEELMKQRGTYHEMFSKQAEYYVESAPAEAKGA